jgi:hypothetical protein
VGSSLMCIGPFTSCLSFQVWSLLWSRSLCWGLRGSAGSELGGPGCHAGSLAAWARLSCVKGEKGRGRYARLLGSQGDDADW